MQMNEVNLAGAMFAYLKFNDVKEFRLLELNDFMLQKLKERNLFITINYDKLIPLGVSVFRNDGIEQIGDKCIITLKEEEIYNIMARLNFQQQDDLKDLALSYKYRLPKSIDSKSFLELLLARTAKFQNSKLIAAIPIDYLKKIEILAQLDKEEFSHFIDYDISKMCLNEHLKEYDFYCNTNTNCYEIPFTMFAKEEITAKYNKETVEKMDKFINRLKIVDASIKAKTLIKKIS